MYWLPAGVLFGTVTSQMIVDFFIIIGWISLITIKLRERKSPTPTSPSFFLRIGIEWALLGYFVVAALSLGFNAPDPVPWFDSMRKFTWIAELYLLIWLLSHPAPPLRRWLSYFALAFVLPNLYALSGVVLGFDPITGSEGPRAVGLVNSATYHAHGNAALFVFFAAIFLKSLPRLSKKESLLISLSFVLMALSIFFTYTRGIWISLTLSSLLLLFMINWKWATRGVIYYAAAFMVLFVSVSSFQNRILAFFTGNKGDQIRKQLYEVFWLMFEDQPWLGIGYWDQYRQIPTYWEKLGLPSDYFISHAHNQYLNVLATTGALGLFFFLSIFGYFFALNVKLLKKPNTESNKILLLACFVTQIEYFLACVTDVTFEYAKLRMILVMVWALLIALRKGSSHVQS